jgi:hypothetical protein
MIINPFCDQPYSRRFRLPYGKEWGGPEHLDLEEGIWYMEGKRILILM